MTLPPKLNRNELDAIKQLEFRFKDDFPSGMNEDGTLFYRFLKARDFDVDKAEAMLRKNIAWRKANQADKLVDTFKPTEVFLKYTGPSRIGFDKDGNSVRYAAIGRIDMTGLTNSTKMNDHMKHMIWTAEYDTHLAKLENMRTGRNAYQEVYIFDLHGFAFATATSSVVSDLIIRGSQLLQDNYPERMKKMYVINAPVFFTVIFPIVKKVMSNAMLKKIHVFGQNGWKEALLEFIDADVLPAFLGGRRTDPDGDPYCRTTVIQGGRVPPQYFLTDEERRFKDVSKVERVVVPPSTDRKISFEVKVRNSMIRWKFETTKKDIGFGLFYQLSENELEEVLPIQRIITCDGTETGFFKPHSTGIYVIVFDNSHSWYNSKEVFYVLNVENLDSPYD